MSDDHETDEESEGKDTEVLPVVDAPPSELEGTLETDRGALFRRLRSDQKQGEGYEKPVDREAFRELCDTVQLPAIGEVTRPTGVADGVVQGQHTEHYEVPDALMDRLRETAENTTRSISYDRTTRPFSSDELYEFVAVIDESGRITIPQTIFDAETIERGATVKVVMRLFDGEK